MEKEQETRLVQADLKRVGSFSHNPDAYFSRPLCQLTDDLAFAIIHPCAPVSSPEGTLSHAFHDYFEEGFWCLSNPSSVRGRVGAYHRTLSTYLNSFLTAGLVLERVLEPQATGPFAANIAGYDRVPVVFIAKWRKGISP